MYSSLLSKKNDSQSLYLLNNYILRSLNKAKYHSSNLGHFGLNFTTYTHFTSPIRRYSDLVVHRLLAYLLNYSKEKPKNLDSVANQCNTSEVTAIKLEREAIKINQLYYLKDSVGIVFDAFISGVIERGIFVECIDNGCEGKLSFSKIPFYLIYDHTKQLFYNKSKKLYLQVGDIVKVKLYNVDLEKKHIDFELIID